MRRRAVADELRRTRQRLQEAFPPAEGYSPVAWVNWLDGLRVGFEDGRIAHLRASGNAPELRLYAVAESPEAADRVVEQVLHGGALARLERLAEELRAAVDFAAAPRPLPLRGMVQHYAWGGTRFIPELLGLADNREPALGRAVARGPPPCAGSSAAGGGPRGVAGAGPADPRGPRRRCWAAPRRGGSGASCPFC